MHACVRAGHSAWRYYQFKDAVEQEARFASRLTESELHQRIVELAEEHQIALAYEDVAVERRGDQTSVSAAYYESIPLVPIVYTREHLFEVDVSVRVMRPLTVDGMK